MQITYYGQSGFEVIIKGKKVLFDPYISDNPVVENIDPDNLQPDFMLITHGHGDHVGDAERILRNSNAQLISNFEIVSHFSGDGIREGHPMNTGGKWDFEFGTVKMVNAIHSSSFPDGSYAGNPVGFVISSEEGTFYHAGDTALHQDMVQIGDEFDLDFAFLPIGDNFTMGIDDALKASELIGTKNIVGMHYNTFPLIEIDENEVMQKAQHEDVKLILPEIGKPFNI